MGELSNTSECTSSIPVTEIHCGQFDFFKLQNTEPMLCNSGICSNAIFTTFADSATANSRLPFGRPDCIPSMAGDACWISSTVSYRTKTCTSNLDRLNNVLSCCMCWPTPNRVLSLIAPTNRYQIDVRTHQPAVFLPIATGKHLPCHWRRRLYWITSCRRSDRTGQPSTGPG